MSTGRKARTLFRKIAAAFGAGGSDPAEAAERALTDRPDGHFRLVGVPEWARPSVEAALAPARITYGLAEPKRAVDAVVVSHWAAESEVRGAAALARSLAKPLFSLRPSPLAAESVEAPASLTVSPEPGWDAAWPSGEIERLLNAPGEVADAAGDDRARAVISAYLAASGADPCPPGARKMLLLVDQPMTPIRDARALVSDMTFKRMIDDAASREDHDIHVALAEAPRSWLKAPRLAAMLRARIGAGRLVIHEGEAAREALLRQADEVAVGSHDAGFRALMTGRKVVCFGAPRYAGWGLTDDRLVIPWRRRARALEDLVYLDLVRFGRHRAMDGAEIEPEALPAARAAAVGTGPTSSAVGAGRSLSEEGAGLHLSPVGRGRPAGPGEGASPSPETLAPPHPLGFADRPLPDPSRVFPTWIPQKSEVGNTRLRRERLAAAPIAIGDRAVPETKGEPSPSEAKTPKRILIIVPGARGGATGRHVETLGNALAARGVSVMTLTEGRPGPGGAGVDWRSIAFRGRRLAPDLRKTIAAFDPEIVHLFGSRTRAQRAALEALALSDARLVIQVEDEDGFIHASQNRTGSENLALLDRPVVAPADVAAFMAGLDWTRALATLDDPEFDRWVEPLLRALCFRMASGVTAIWTPLAERLSAEFARPTAVLPPSVPGGDFERPAMSPEARAAALRRRGLHPDGVTFFTGGRVYGYSDAFRSFVRALNLLADETGAKLSLVVTGVESGHAEAAAREELSPKIGFANLGRANDADYAEMLDACDVVCAPGADDPFDRYRLPSRLTRAMAMGKAVLTADVGFGASLTHGRDAVLTTGRDPAEWAARMRPLLDAAQRRGLGLEARRFAHARFEAGRVADGILGFLGELLAQGDAPVDLGLDLRDAAAPRVAARGACDFEVALDALTRRGVWRLDASLMFVEKFVDLVEWSRFGIARMVVLRGPGADFDADDFAGAPGVEVIELGEAGKSALEQGLERLGDAPREHALLAISVRDSKAGAFALDPDLVADRFAFAAFAGSREFAHRFADEIAAFEASPRVERMISRETFGEASVNELYRLLPKS